MHYSDRDIVEETPSFTIYEIERWRRYANSFSYCGRIIYFGDHPISLFITSNSTHRGFRYLDIQYYWDKEIREISIDLYAHPCHFGGYRYYFICPMTGKKVTTLYVSKDGRIASRGYLLLSYRLSRSHRSRYEELDKSKNHKKRANAYLQQGHPRKAKACHTQAQKHKEKAITELTDYLRKINSDASRNLTLLELLTDSFHE